MPKQTLFGCVLLISILLLPSAAHAGIGSKAINVTLKRSYGANEWHMKRFMSEFVSLERQFASNPNDPEFVKRLRNLKIQIDVLTRENERILNSAEPD